MVEVSTIIAQEAQEALDKLAGGEEPREVILGLLRANQDLLEAQREAAEERERVLETAQEQLLEDWNIGTEGVAYDVLHAIEVRHDRLRHRDPFALCRDEVCEDLQKAVKDAQKNHLGR